ncbi:hypothetical protein PMAC_003032 [Pneumocystis sp. 'macacae']|nr:hypothetical protein PMAC_003032 [Pneumocystis sp. 'macacae']
MRSTFLAKNGKKTYLIDELKARGLIEIISSESKFKEKIHTDNLSIYMGIDPTASSLHIGNLVTILSLFHFYLRGHNCYSIVGGGTSRIGDPSGKTKQRKVLKWDFISKNALEIKDQLNSFFKNGLIYALKRGYNVSDAGKYYIMNNLEWYDGFSLFDFLKVVGPNIKVREMLSRDSVKSRLDSDQGISYGEFTYQLLQAYDFYYLNQNYNVSVQIGGNDQWGNIVAGIELINKINNLKDCRKNPISIMQPCGITVPLLLKKNGEKFSKSIGDTVWLNSDMTSPYQLYQFFVQSSDEIVEKYLKIFTLLPLDTISEIMEHHFNAPDKRYAQHKLAEEVVMLIHGQEEMKKSKMAAQLLFSDKGKNKLKVSHIFEIFTNKQDIITLNKEKVIGRTVPQVIKESGVLTQINKLFRSGGIYTIKEKITSSFIQITKDWLIEEKILILKLGKKRHIIINMLEDVNKNEEKKIFITSTELSTSFFISFLSGGIAGIVSRTVVSPLERVKIIFQIQDKNKHYQGIMSALSKIWKEEGFKGYMRGNGVNCLRIFPYSSTQFASYTVYKENYKLTVFKLLMPFGKTELDTPQRLTAGALAGITSVEVVTYPLDITRTRLSIQSASLPLKLINRNQELPGIWKTMKNIYIIEGGLKALYKGIWPTILGIAPYVGLNFAIYESMKKLISQEDGQPTVFGKFFSGAISGAIAQTITYPADVLRRRFQVAYMPGINYRYVSIYDALKQILAQQGWKGFYQGLLPNLLKVIPSMGTSWLSYEISKDFFSEVIKY